MIKFAVVFCLLGLAAASPLGTILEEWKVKQSHEIFLAINKTIEYQRHGSYNMEKITRTTVYTR